MFFLNLSLLEFIGVLGTLSSLVVALYLLDRVRNKHVVPTLRFFQTAEKPPEQKHRRKLQQPWSLILRTRGGSCARVRNPDEARSPGSLEVWRIALRRLRN